MYSMEKDNYSCDFCGFEMEWNGIDEEHGTMWGCEICGREFCSQCFIDRFGYYAYKMMLCGVLPFPLDDGKIRCPKCYEEEET